MIYFTADTHFYHENIIKYCDRKFDTVEEMNQTIITRWNDRVSKNDTVYHLGDFVCHYIPGIKNRKEFIPILRKKTKELIDKLNGNIILIAGNHDRATFDGVFEELGLTGFYECDMVLNITGIGEVKMAHHPQYEGEGIILCGHVHEKWIVKRPTEKLININVGVDQWDYYPITDKEIKRLLVKEQFSSGIA